MEHPEITDKEHKGKPYYSIKYVEDREKYIGFGTYKIEVLSSYIRDYFIPPAEPERKIYANMPDADFEKWLHDHGICNPNIHEAIPCSCVPLLIDSAINEIISVEPESDGNGSVSADTHEKMPDRTMGDLISRQEATTIPVMPVEYREYQTMNLDDAYEQGWFDLQKCIEELPYAKPERLTDDDFETIRIHLNAYKEKLCNQQRWEEAEEYQCIIDRFMAFASAEPERKGRRMYAIRNRKTKKWVYGTDYRYSPRRQRTSFDRALTYEDYDHAKLDFMSRQCGKDYEIVPVVITEVRGEQE